MQKIKTLFNNAKNFFYNDRLHPKKDAMALFGCCWGSVILTVGIIIGNPILIGIGAAVLALAGTAATFLIGDEIRHSYKHRNDKAASQNEIDNILRKGSGLRGLTKAELATLEQDERAVAFKDNKVQKTDDGKNWRYNTNPNPNTAPTWEVIQNKENISFLDKYTKTIGVSNSERRDKSIRGTFIEGILEKGRSATHVGAGWQTTNNNGTVVR